MVNTYNTKGGHRVFLDEEGGKGASDDFPPIVEWFIMTWPLHCLGPCFQNLYIHTSTSLSATRLGLLLLLAPETVS